jgi:hypothetical protein
MAYLNKQEREALLNDLAKMSFNQAKGKLRRMDPKGRLAFYRNIQSTTNYHTRFDLEGLGTRVTLIERQVENPAKKPGNVAADFELAEVIVEPLPGNRT